MSLAKLLQKLPPEQIAAYHLENTNAFKIFCLNYYAANRDRFKNGVIGESQRFELIKEALSQYTKAEENTGQLH